MGTPGSKYPKIFKFTAKIKGKNIYDTKIIVK